MSEPVRAEAPGSEIPPHRYNADLAAELAVLAVAMDRLVVVADGEGPAPGSRRAPPVAGGPVERGRFV